jgi:hypothetical protein
MATKDKNMRRVRRVRKAPPGAAAERTSDEIADIVRTLGGTVEALKSADCPRGCGHVKPLIEMYEWALEEFNQATDDGGKPTSERRIAELCRVLNVLLR